MNNGQTLQLNEYTKDVRRWCARMDEQVKVNFDINAVGVYDAGNPGGDFMVTVAEKTGFLVLG